MSYPPIAATFTPIDGGMGTLPPGVPYGMGKNLPVARARSGRQPSSTLHMAEIDESMNDTILYQALISADGLLRVNIIRDKNTGRYTGYGFLYFNNVQNAQAALETYNGRPIPGTHKVFKLDFATEKNNAKPKSDADSGQIEESEALYVTSLAPDVTDEILLNTFQYYYPSTYDSRVILDQITGISKGIGYIYFRDKSEKTLALSQMKGFMLHYRPISVDIASKRGSDAALQQNIAQQMPMHPMGPEMGPGRGKRPAPMDNDIYYQPPSSHQAEVDRGNDSTNTTILVSAMDPSVTEDVLRDFFSKFGSIISIRIPKAKNIAFIEFETHESAATALKTLPQNPSIGASQVKVSWSKRPFGKDGKPGGPSDRSRQQRPSSPPQSGYYSQPNYSQPPMQPYGNYNPGYNPYQQSYGYNAPANYNYGYGAMPNYNYGSYPGYNTGGYATTQQGYSSAAYNTSNVSNANSGTPGYNPAAATAGYNTTSTGYAAYGYTQPAAASTSTNVTTTPPTNISSPTSSGDSNPTKKPKF